MQKLLSGYCFEHRLTSSEFPMANNGNSDQLTTLTRHLVLLGRSPQTIRNYRDAVRRLDRWAQSRKLGPVLELDPLAIAAYVDELPGRAAKALLRSSLRALFAAHGLPDDVAGAIRVPRRRQMRSKALSEFEAVKLANHVEARGDLLGLACLFGLYGAFRRSEIARVRWDEILDGEVTWIRLVGKGNISAELPVHPVLALALVSARARGSGEFVFPGAGGAGHACPATIWKWVKQVGQESGIPDLTPHRLRHTALATSLDTTGDLRAVMEFARHARPETTAGYTRTVERRLIGAVVAIDYERAAREAAEIPSYRKDVAS